MRDVPPRLSGPGSERALRKRLSLSRRVFLGWGALVHVWDGEREAEGEGEGARHGFPERLRRELDREVSS